MGYLLFLLCHTSEVLKVKIQSLEKFLMKLYSKSDETVMVCTLLARFQGFDANGYFNVNHSLLTAMTANFVTYLVILIQFDQSENSSELATLENSEI